MKKRIGSYPRVRIEGGGRAVLSQADGVLLVETVRKTGLDTAISAALMPRLKNIGSAKLYRPAAGQDDQWPNLGPVLSTKTIDWDVIAQQYDQIVKYTTALRPGTAEAEQVLRRLTRGGPKHPTGR